MSYTEVLRHAGHSIRQKSSVRVHWRRAFEDAAGEDCGLEMERDRFSSPALFYCDTVATRCLLLQWLLARCCSVNEDEEKHLSVSYTTTPRLTTEHRFESTQNSSSLIVSRANDYYLSWGDSLILICFSVRWLVNRIAHKLQNGFPQNLNGGWVSAQSKHTFGEDKGTDQGFLFSLSLPSPDGAFLGIFIHFSGNSVLMVKIRGIRVSYLWVWRKGDCWAVAEECALLSVILVFHLLILLIYYFLDYMKCWIKA